MKFKRVDPLAMDYAYKRTYDYAENSPVVNIDLDGLEGLRSTPFFQSSFNCHVCTTTGGLRASYPVNHIPTSPRSAAITQGISNTVFGIVGTIGLTLALPETGGTSALAYNLTIPEIGIGLAQTLDGFINSKFDTDENYMSESYLYKASSLPGLVAYGANSQHAPFIDAIGQFGAGYGMNIKSLFSFGNTFRSKTLFSATYNALGQIDALNDTKGLIDAASSGPETETKTNNSQMSQAELQSLVDYINTFRREE